MKLNPPAIKDALVEIHDQAMGRRSEGTRNISFIPQLKASGEPIELEITFRIPRHTGPALKSAITEIRNEVGGRLEGPHDYAIESALTLAAAALGPLARAIALQVPNYDPNYKSRTGSIG